MASLPKEPAFVTKYQAALEKDTTHQEYESTEPVALQGDTNNTHRLIAHIDNYVRYFRV